MTSAQPSAVQTAASVPIGEAQGSAAPVTGPIGILSWTGPVPGVFDTLAT